MRNKELTFSVSTIIDDEQVAYLIHRRDDGAWKVYTDISDTQNDDIDNIQVCGRHFVISSRENKTFLISNDNGKSFNEIPYTEEMLAHPVTYVLMLDRYNILACAKDGYIFHSSDGGFLWNAIQNGGITSHDYNVIEACSKNKRVVCVGGNCGTLLLSTDAARSFRLLDTSFTNDVTAIYLFSDKHIVAGCKNGFVYETLDSGHTWVEITPPDDMLMGENCVIEDIFSW